MERKSRKFSNRIRPKKPANGNAKMLSSFYCENHPSKIESNERKRERRSFFSSVAWRLRRRLTYLKLPVKIRTFPADYSLLLFVPRVFARSWEIGAIILWLSGTKSWFFFSSWSPFFLKRDFPLRKMLSGEPLKSPLKTLEGISSHLFREETIKESSLKTFSFQNYDNAPVDWMFVIISPFYIWDFLALFHF